MSLSDDISGITKMGLITVASLGTVKLVSDMADTTANRKKGKKKKRKSKQIDLDFGDFY